METKFHKGVAYTILKLGKDHWRWEVKPPLSVRGPEPATGVFIGAARKAHDIAKAEIDLQIDRIEKPHVDQSRH